MCMFIIGPFRTSINNLIWLLFKLKNMCAHVLNKSNLKSYTHVCVNSVNFVDLIKETHTWLIKLILINTCVHLSTLK